MAKIRWTIESERWLKDIYEFIAMDNPGSAGKVVKNIYEKVKTLKQFPQSGYMYKDVSEGEIRILLYGHYRIAYLFRSDNVIDILGIFHGALDIEKYLF